MHKTSDDSRESDEQRLAPVREGEWVANKYLAGRVLGVGGMGVVIEATDKLLGRKVAIKFLLPSLANSERAVQRFVREARSASKISSEHVVKLLEIDMLPSGMPFFVMEYLEGHDLRATLAERGPLAVKRAVDYLLQALEAIAEGHLHGIVHRDLKPGNLFVTKRADGTPLVKVLDFGIAKTRDVNFADEPGLTGSDDVRLGSPAYMSPEQLQRPNDVDARSDVWALGVTLYELVSGDHPFRGQTYADLILSITTGAPQPLSSQRGNVSLPRGLNDVVLRCLEKDRSRRYQDVAELAAALAGYGTELARASLKRINGLLTSSGDDPGYSTTTLASEDVSERNGRKSGASAKDRAPVKVRNVAVAVLSLIVVAIAAVAWNRRAQGPPETKPLQTHVEAVAPATPPVVTPPVTAEKKSATIEVAPAAKLETPPAETRPASPTARAPTPSRAATTHRPTVATASPTKPTPEEPSEPQPAPAASRTGPTSASFDSLDAEPPPPGSRSTVIEKLIEKRR